MNLGMQFLHTNMVISLFIENYLQTKNKYEIQTDKFAAELLIDINNDYYLYKDMNIKQLSSILCISERLIEYKYVSTA